MKKAIYVWFTVIVLVSSIFLAACAPASTPAPAPAPAEKYGGILKVISEGRGIASFGYPPEVWGPNFQGTNPVLETLLDFDAQGRPLPRLATDWKLSQDGKVLTLELRKGVKFHDGTDFNADAAKWNLDARKAANPGDFPTVTSFDVVDPYTIRINLSEWSNILLTSLAMDPGLMASPTAIDKNGKDWAKTNPVGTGPFKFVGYEKDVYLKFEKFDDYWDKGKPYLDGVEYKLVADPMVAAAAFQAGEAQVNLTLAPAEAASLKEKGYHLVAAVKGVPILMFDTANKDSVFANKKVREAIEYAIDRPAIASSLGHGFWEATNQLATKNHYGYIPNFEGRPYNVAKAKQLMEEAGYADGFKTKLIVHHPLGRDLPVALQGYLGKIGIELELEFPDMGKFTEYRMKGWNNCILGAAIAMEPAFVRSLDYTLGPQSLVYPSMLKPAGFHDLLKQATTTNDFETQKDLAQQMVKLLHDECGLVPLFADVQIAGIDESVHDAGFNEVHFLRWNPAAAWLSK